jgi:hypothetical protein
MGLRYEHSAGVRIRTSNFLSTYPALLEKVEVGIGHIIKVDNEDTCIVPKAFGNLLKEPKIGSQKLTVQPGEHLRKE